MGRWGNVSQGDCFGEFYLFSFICMCERSLTFLKLTCNLPHFQFSHPTT
jgi:hypothetical protein